jgi:hypothetical protein
MKKTILTILAILLIGAGLMMGEGAAQSPPAMKVVLTFPPDKEIYGPGEPIEAFLNIANVSTTNIITSKGFSNTSFHLLLVITDPDGKVITTNSLGASNPYTPLLPELAPVMTPEGEKMLQVESVEIWPAAPDPDWSRSFKFNLLEYYTVQKGGKYVVKASIPMRTYSYPILDPTNMYALLGSSNWAGNIESNIASFTLTALDHITISPTSSTITAGGSQSYTIRAFDVNSNGTDVTAQTQLTISPNGSCTGNTCTATVGGVHSVLATYSGKTATASLFVYAFSGFFPPVNNLPVLNSVKAGQAVPVKFSLHGNMGLDIFSAGYPTSGTIACSSAAQVDPVEQTVTAGGSSLSYDPASDQYNYVWKTNKSWANSCRQLVLKFKDGTYQRANFKFTR